MAAAADPATAVTAALAAEADTVAAAVEAAADGADPIEVANLS